MSERSAASVWMVEEHDYDSCRHYGIFSTREKAEEVRALLDRVGDDGLSGTVYVHEYTVDPDRRRIQVIYYVELFADGTVENEGWNTWCLPDQDWDSGVLGAHWWTDAHGVRAVGVDRDEAMARAREMLKHPAPAHEQQAV